MKPLVIILIIACVRGRLEDISDEKRKEKEDLSWLAPPFHMIIVPTDHYIMPILKYDLEDMEPYIDKETMEAHYNGHHEAYRNKTNKAMHDMKAEFPDHKLSGVSILDVMMNIENVHDKYKKTFKKQGGGFVNHNFVWGSISPNPNGTERMPSGKLLEDINTAFGSFEAFKEKFTKEALSVFGSGYVWLSRRWDTHKDELYLTTTANQESPISLGFDPIMVLDVWEHAYYLKHQFRRAEYIKNWWMVLDWERVAEADGWWLNVKAMKAKSAKEEL